MKLSDLINLKIMPLKPKGFLSYTSSKSNPNQTFRVGRKKDYSKEPWIEGNFECAVALKGVKKDQWKWETIPFVKEHWWSKFSLPVVIDGQQRQKPDGTFYAEYVELTYTQHEHLLACLNNEAEVWIYPYVDGKTINFSRNQHRVAPAFAAPQTAQPIQNDYI